MAEQILKKEDSLKFIGGLFNSGTGILVLTSTELYLENKSKRLFSTALKDILSINCKKGIGTGVDHMFVIYQKDGKENRAKIEHFSFFSAMTIGNLSRLALYFSSWEQAINDARFHKNETNIGGFDSIEKLAELKQKGIITEEEFSAKKKQILGI